MGDDCELPNLAGALQMALTDASEAVLQEVEPGAMVTGYVAFVRWVRKDGSPAWSMATYPGQQTDTDLGLLRAATIIAEERLVNQWSH